MILNLYPAAVTAALTTGLRLATPRAALLAASYAPGDQAAWPEIAGHEIAPAPGYSGNGGIAVGGELQISGNLFRLQPPDLVFSNLEATFAYLVIYGDDGPQPLLGWADFGSEITIPGYSFIIKWSPAGLLEIEKI
jgi:hypothetical protein